MSTLWEKLFEMLTSLHSTEAIRPSCPSRILNTVNVCRFYSQHSSFHSCSFFTSFLNSVGDLTADFPPQRLSLQTPLSEVLREQCVWEGVQTAYGLSPGCQKQNNKSVVSVSRKVVCCANGRREQGGKGFSLEIRASAAKAA